jgi:hypothetical protein
LGYSDYSPIKPDAYNLTKFLQFIVSARDYDPTSTDPLKNKHVVVIDYEAFGHDYYATATSNSTFDLVGNLREHIVWTRDTEALGGMIAYQYAVSGNINAVSLDERQAILADPNLNLVGQSILGIDV